MSITNFASFPAELIAELTRRLPGSQVTRLWMCGSKLLMYKMSEQGGVPVLRIDYYKDFEQWPAIIPSFKRIEALEISNGHPNNIFGDPEEAFNLWPKTITSLKFCCRQAEKCWTRKDKSVLDIGALFPLLKHLTLEGWAGFSLANAKTLPTGLESLSLPMNRLLLRATKRLSDYLPAELLHLALEGLEESLDEHCQYMPPKLKSLSLNARAEMSAVGMRSLPQTLKKLKLGFLQNIPLEMLQAVPRSVTWLETWYGISNTLSAQNVAALPPALEAFITGPTGNLPHFGAETFDLPRTLTRFEVAGNAPILMDQHISGFPPGLLWLELGSTPRLTDDAIEHLPRALQHLSLDSTSGLTNNCIAHLPPYLRHLNLRHEQNIKGDTFHLLPRTLEFLCLANISHVLDEHIAHLPKFLTHLNLDGASQLTDACIASLPRGLTTLSFASGMHFTFSCVPDLPLYINEIDMGPTGVADKYKLERKRRANRGW